MNHSSIPDYEHKQNQQQLRDFEAQGYRFEITSEKYMVWYLNDFIGGAQSGRSDTGYYQVKKRKSHQGTMADLREHLRSAVQTAQRHQDKQIAVKGKLTWVGGNAPLRGASSQNTQSVATQNSITNLLKNSDVEPSFIQDAFRVFNEEMEYTHWHQKYALADIKGNSVEESVLLQINEVLRLNGLEDLESFLAKDNIAAICLDAGNSCFTTVVYDRIWDRLIITTKYGHLEFLKIIEQMVETIVAKFTSEEDVDWVTFTDPETGHWQFPIAICQKQDYLELYLGSSTKALVDSRFLYAITHLGSRVAIGLREEEEGCREKVIQLVIDLYRQLLILNGVRERIESDRVRFLKEIESNIILYRDESTGLAFIQDGKTGRHISIHPNIDLTGSIEGMVSNGGWSRQDTIISNQFGHYNVSHKIITDDLDKIVRDNCRCKGCTSGALGILYDNQLTVNYPIFGDVATAEAFEYAVARYSFLLNTPDRRHKIYPWSQFAEFVAVDTYNPKAVRAAKLIVRRMGQIDFADPKQDLMSEWTFIYNHFRINVGVYRNPYRLWISHLPNFYNLSDFNEKLLVDLVSNINLDGDLELYSDWNINDDRSAYCRFRETTSD